ncbi:hypothetical protein, partial [Achromobacter insuavis]|uniref:hypothetical protein n=1 Tax=Achromobacter insuavis TaxID=1287735 RepID=UPI001F134772
WFARGERLRRPQTVVGLAVFLWRAAFGLRFFDGLPFLSFLSPSSSLSASQGSRALSYSLLQA